MIFSHQGKSPIIDPTAWIAPSAVICGDVNIGPDARILYGATMVAENGSIKIGRNGIVLENAVLRSTERHDLHIGDYCLVGPHAHVVGAHIEDQVFIATGASVFHGAVVAEKSEIRVNGVVHVRSRLAPKSTVPIGWIAVGDPAEILPPENHKKIWEMQKPMNFPLEAYGIDRDQADMKKITTRMSQNMAAHRNNQRIT